MDIVPSPTRHIEHPAWCDPPRCSARPNGSGTHASEPLQIPTESGTVALYLNGTPRGRDRIVLEFVPEIFDSTDDGADIAASIIALDMLEAVGLRDDLDRLISASVRAMFDAANRARSGPGRQSW